MLLELDNEAASISFLGKIVIGTCTLPEEMSLLILGFLPKTDLVQTKSLVSTMWCNLSKSPLLWQSLDFPRELKASKKRLSSMARFTELLQRPQFAFSGNSVFRTFPERALEVISKHFLRHALCSNS
jgi:hypothetical protein